MHTLNPRKRCGSPGASRVYQDRGFAARRHLVPHLVEGVSPSFHEAPGDPTWTSLTSHQSRRPSSQSEARLPSHQTMINPDAAPASMPLQGLSTRPETLSLGLPTDSPARDGVETQGATLAESAQNGCDRVLCGNVLVRPGRPSINHLLQIFCSPFPLVTLTHSSASS
jgi:hypothetical protein